jgi:DNA-binding NtrC family response regulator
VEQQFGSLQIGDNVVETGMRDDVKAPARRVLIVDDETNMQVVLSAAFEDAGFATGTASTGEEAIRALTQTDYDLMLLDLKLPDMTGIDVFRHAREASPGTIVIMITAYSSVETAIEAMKMGAYDYITKPFNLEKLLMIAGNAIDARRCARIDSGSSAGLLPSTRLVRGGLERNAMRGDTAKAGSAVAFHGGKAAGTLSQADWALSGIELVAEDEDFDGVVGVTPQMRQLMEMSRDIAPTNATVLIYGESGTGKELVADYIHKKSLRAGRPFIKVNCAAIPEPLLESELFGHEKGAFTHAISRRLGRFELADKGSILLDEVGEMSNAMQAKLLRVLQEKEFERVGGTETIKVDVRVIAATNQNLKEAVLRGDFREDLYYRLSVVPLFLPPLRDRKRDIPLLCARFIDKYNKEFGREVSGVSPKVLEMFAEYDWPGNIRELQNAMERAVLLSRSDVLTPDDFHLGMDPAEIISLGTGVTCRSCANSRLAGRNWDGSGADMVSDGADGYIEILDENGSPLSLEEMEKRHIKAVLDQFNWNKTQAAQALNITRRTLLNKINKYDL